MKLTTAVVIALGLFATSAARADGDDPLTDTEATKAGDTWVGALLAPGGAIAAPSKDKPLDYVVVSPAKPCKAMKTGTAKDVKAAMKLKTCVAAIHKGLGSAAPGDWFELRPSGLDTVVSAFPSKYGKKIRAGAKDSTIVQGHYVGEGLNMDVYLAMDADRHVHAVWVAIEAYE